jgi:hypothetical protein
MCAQKLEHNIALSLSLLLLPLPNFTLCSSLTLWYFQLYVAIPIAIPVCRLFLLNGLFWLSSLWCTPRVSPTSPIILFPGGVCVCFTPSIIFGNFDGEYVAKARLCLFV